MRKVNIAVVGPIGVGKTTFIRNLSEELKNYNFETKVVNEPSVSIVPVNQLLERLYKDVKKWAYPLQAAISTSQEAEYELAKEEEYDYAIFDMPYSSYMYCNIHTKHKRMTEKEKRNIINISRPFKFDYIIILSADEETIINHVKGRNEDCKDKDPNKAGDVEVSYDYLKEHLADFQEFLPSWISKYFLNSKKFNIVVEDNSKKEYKEQIEYITEEIINGGK